MTSAARNTARKGRAAEMADNILEIRHLSKSFGTHEVLRDIDFTVSKGDVEHAP